MQNPRIIFGIEEGRLTASFAGEVLAGAEKLVKDLTPETEQLGLILLERIANLSSSTGTVRVELPGENIVRTVHTGEAPKLPNVA